MKAMILAAGLGTRLRPITDDRPKALVAVEGRTMLEITLTRLRRFGVHEVIVNVHHHADMILEYLKANHHFGMRIEVSREEVLLDTGGGLKRAAWFFRESTADSNEPFLLHNVDVLSSIDLARMVQFHSKQDALATLAAQNRKTSRPLLFDTKAQLRGRGVGVDEIGDQVRPALDVEALAFSGIHVLSPRIFAMLNEDGAFSIISTYLRLAERGEKILAFHADEYYWRDLGRPESISQAALDLADGTCAGI